MTDQWREICAAKFVLLTTFRKDGTAVPTPLWAVADGDRLLMWTVTDSWKVKRIRRNPAVTVAVCDARGGVIGPPVDAHAEVLDDKGSDRVRSLIARKYGIAGRLVMAGSRFRRGRTGTVGIAITRRV